MTSVRPKVLPEHTQPSSTSFFLVCLGPRTPGRAPHPVHSLGFLVLKNLELLPGPPGVQPARHVFTPPGRTQSVPRPTTAPPPYNLL